MYTLSWTKWTTWFFSLKVHNDLEVERRAGGKLWTCNGKCTVSIWCTTRWWYHEIKVWCWIELMTCGTADRHCQIMDKYPSVVPFRQPYISTHSLYWYVVAPAASVSPSEAVSHGRICGHLPSAERPRWQQIAPGPVRTVVDLQEPRCSSRPWTWWMRWPRSSKQNVAVICKYCEVYARLRSTNRRVV